MPPREQGPQPAAGWTTNVASGDARVGMQGAVINNPVIHEENYYLDRETPEQRFELAVRLLEGRNPAAREHFQELVGIGYERPELPYYYALALFSDRSTTDLADTDVYDQFRLARRMAGRIAHSGWETAFQVVSEVLSCVLGQDRWEELDPAALDSAKRKFSALPAERQEEIRLHLAPLLGIAIQEGLDAVAAVKVSKQRLDRQRSERAWLFFEAKPAEPRLVEPEPTKVGGDRWVRIVGGSIALSIGLLAPLSPLGAGNLTVGAPTLLLFLAGTSCMFWFGRQRDVEVERLARRNLEHGIPLQQEPPRSPGHWVETEFVKGVHQLVDDHFAAARPHLGGSWDKDTEGLREHYKRRFVSHYGNAQLDADQLSWLIRWHARRAAARWRAGTLFAYQKELASSGSTAALYYLGIAVAVASALVMVGALGGFTATALVLGGGMLQAVRALTAVIAIKRCDAEDRERSRQLADQERDAYESWLVTLRGRPSDMEMARWLDLDKSHLETRALQRYLLSNEDLVSHAVLTVGSSSGRARVPHGPWRYPSYRVLVFLLTKFGVREVEYDLAFLDGSVRNEHRRLFRYDALAAAHVSERRSKRRRGPADGEQAIDERALHNRYFRLSLVSGEDIVRMRVRGFTAAADARVASESKKLRANLLSSGIAGSLRLLEVVSAEGRAWIPREQKRRRWLAEEWQRGEGAAGAEGPPDPFAW